MNKILQSVSKLRLQTIQFFIKKQDKNINLNYDKFNKNDKDIKIPCGVLKYDSEPSICKNKVKEEIIVNC